MIRFWAAYADKNEGSFALQRIRNIVSVIVKKSNTQPFHISPLLNWMANRSSPEFLNLIKEHLFIIIDNPELHGWKIHDAINILLKFDPDFVKGLLLEKGKALKEFSFK